MFLDLYDLIFTINFEVNFSFNVLIIFTNILLIISFFLTILIISLKFLGIIFVIKYLNYFIRSEFFKLWLRYFFLKMSYFLIVVFNYKRISELIILSMCTILVKFFFFKLLTKYFCIKNIKRYILLTVNKYFTYFFFHLYYWFFIYLLFILVLFSGLYSNFLINFSYFLFLYYYKILFILFLISFNFFLLNYYILYLKIIFFFRLSYYYIQYFFYFLSIFYLLRMFFFFEYIITQIILLIVFSWIILLILFRYFVISYDTSWLHYNYKEKRKRIIYPLILVLKFYLRLVYKCLLLILLISKYWNIQGFFNFFFLYKVKLFNFFFVYNFFFLWNIFGFFFSCFLCLSYWKKIAFYIFNYRRLVWYSHWLGRQILGFEYKEFLFRWINMFFSSIQFWRYSKLERRRWFMQCYWFEIEEFLLIGLIYYFKRWLLKFTRAVFYYYINGNFIIKKLKFFIDFFLSFFFFLKYTFIHIRYRRLLLLIFIRNYSFLRVFMIFSLKLHFYSLQKQFKFSKKKTFINAIYL